MYWLLQCIGRSKEILEDLSYKALNVLSNTMHFNEAGVSNELLSFDSMWSSLSWKLTVAQVVNKFPALYVAWQFITMFKRGHYWIESWNGMKLANALIPYFFTVHFNIRPASSKWLFPSGFPTDNFCTHVSQPFHACYITCPSHPSWSYYTEWSRSHPTHSRHMSYLSKT